MLPCGSAVANTNRVLYMTTSSNLLSISNAVKIASGLQVGMAGQDVQKYMQDYGLVQTNIYSISMDGWRTCICPYPLTDGATLMLDMHCIQGHTSALFGHSVSVLDGARIQSQGMDIIAIKLANTPKTIESSTAQKNR
jgi:hypothetical protein